MTATADSGAELARLAEFLPEGIAVNRDDSANIPRGEGAYAVLVMLTRPAAFARGKLTAHFTPGSYVYAGSARGPGGLRARLTRHFAAEKARRWHIDDLTTEAAAMAALAIPGGDECAIVARLLASGAYETALPGFGSSDCRICEAHLLRAINAA